MGGCLRECCCQTAKVRSFYCGLGMNLMLFSFELKSLTRFALWQSLVLGIFWASGRLVVLCAVLTYMFVGNDITAEKVKYQLT